MRKKWEKRGEEEEGGKEVEGGEEEEFPPHNMPKNPRKLSLEEMRGPSHRSRVSGVKNLDMLQIFVKK